MNPYIIKEILSNINIITISKCSKYIDINYRFICDFSEVFYICFF